MNFKKLVFVGGVVLAVAGTHDGHAMKRNLLSLENSKKKVDEYYKATFEALDELELRLAEENKVKDEAIDRGLKAHDEQLKKNQKEHDAKMRIRREQFEKNQQVLDRSTKTSAKNSGSPLHVAVKNGDIEIINKILEEVYTSTKKQVLVLAVDENGCTPIHLAAEGGLADVIVTLLEVFGYISSKNKKAAISIQDHKGCTALHLAVKNNCVPVAKILIESLGYSSSDKKAFASIRNHNNRTAYDIAKELELKDMVEFLKTYQ